MQLASNYFNVEITKISADEGPVNSLQTINPTILKYMVEWDSRMKILTQGERSYLADLAYELKPLNAFHRANAQRHLLTLLKAGFKMKVPVE